MIERFDEPDAAIEILEQGFADHPFGAEVMWLPMYDPIRDDPRFEAIVESMGRPE